MKCTIDGCPNDSEDYGPCVDHVAAGSPIDDGPNVLGIDPGLASCGLAVVCQRYVRGHHTIRTKTDRPTSERLAFIARVVDHWLATWSPTLVAFEEYPKADRNREKTDANARLVHRVVGVVAGVAALRSVPVREVMPNTLKKAIAGSGRATKDDVRRAVLGRITNESLGRSSNHVHDAIAAGLWGEITLRLEGARRG